MSNRLVVTLTEFRTPSSQDQLSVGYVASDNYGSAFDCSHDSWAEFFEAFPTPLALANAVLSQQAFEDLTLAEESSDENPLLEDMGTLVVEGFNPKDLCRSSKV